MRVVVTGASGQLGSYLLPALAARHHDVLGWSRTITGSISGIAIKRVELTEPRALAQALEEARPDAIIHAGAVSSAAAAHADPEHAHQVNVQSTRTIADWALARRCKIVFTSTDLVFDGTRSWYKENDPAHPIMTYGQTKRAAEECMLELGAGVVARLSLLYGPSLAGRRGFYDQAVAALQAGQPQSFFGDEYRTPLDYRTAAAILARLAESDHVGLIHVGGAIRLSRFELMERIAGALGISPALVIRGRIRDVSFAEPRPADVSLDTTCLIKQFPDLAIPSVEQVVAGLRTGSLPGC